MAKAIEELKISVYGENHDEEEQASNAARDDASKKRKAIADRASKESQSYDWPDLAESGKVRQSETQNYLWLIKFKCVVKDGLVIMEEMARSLVGNVSNINCVWNDIFFCLLQLKDLTVQELKYYLAAHNLPVTGKKEVLISRILTHLGK